MLRVAMYRLVAILIGVLLLTGQRVAAQDADPFRSAAPPSVTAPGKDPFQMAPADPPPAPKPAPRPRPAPEPEPVVAAPPPPPPPPPSPAPKYDGVYSGDIRVAMDSSNAWGPVTHL
jgi:hypothetical protein